MENPGMQTSNTIDFGVVLSSDIWLELDDRVHVLAQVAWPGKA